MSLKSALQNAAQSAFNSFGDLRETITFNSRSQTYTVATGAIADDDTSTSTKAIVSAYTNEERISGAEILNEDLRVTFPAKGLTFTPETQDTITWSTSTYEIVSVELDSAQAMYNLQVRKQ